MKARLGIGPWGATLDEFVTAAVAAEDAGFECVYAPELHRSAFLPLAAVAGRTRRVGLASAIALAFVRSPLTTALEGLDLDELSRGRFVMGLGSGVKRLNEDWHNVPFGGAARHLRETIQILRLVWTRIRSGEPVHFEGRWERIDLRGYQRPFPQQRELIPIYVAAVGPLMTAMAGEIADGWIGHELGSVAYLGQEILPNLRSGWERAGRAREDLTLVAGACCVIHPDRGEARHRAAGLVAFYASVRSYTDLFAWHGFQAEAVEIQRLFRVGDTTGMVVAVTEEMVDALTVAGTIDDVRRRLSEYGELVDVIKLTPPTHLVPETVTREAQQAILELGAG